MIFQAYVSVDLQGEAPAHVDVRQVLEVCPSCVTDGRQQDPRDGRPHLNDAIRVVEAPCSIHQRDRR